MSDQERANGLVEQANELQKAGDKLTAAPMYVEAAQLFAPYASFALVAGDTYSASGQDEQAIEAYRVCIAGVPDHDQAWLGLGEVLKRSGNESEARDAYKRAGVAYPADGFLKRWFGIG